MSFYNINVISTNFVSVHIDLYFEVNIPGNAYTVLVSESKNSLNWYQTMFYEGIHDVNETFICVEILRYM